MVTIDVPFDDFTVRWDDATGDPIVTCEQDEKYCPDLETLQDMKAIQIWGEGVAGKVHLEIESIAASGCSDSSKIQAKTVCSSSIIFQPTAIAALAAMLVLAALRKKSSKGYVSLKRDDRKAVALDLPTMG